MLHHECGLCKLTMLQRDGAGVHEAPRVCVYTLVCGVTWVGVCECACVYMCVCVCVCVC